MCGIAGFVDSSATKSKEELEDLASRLAGSITHRGPDSSGTWVDERAGLAMGHRRLAIIDISPAGHQPMVSGSGNLVLNFNGEIYNFRSIRDQLRTDGVRFRGRSDTEVLVEAIDHWGLITTLARCRGMFAFAVWDRRARSLMLVRDRMGEKPLYYGWFGSTFLFASELKAITAHPGFSGELDRDALALYLRYNHVPTPYSVYRGIRKLTPGTYVTIAGQRPGALPDPEPYWSLGDVAELGARDGRDASPDRAVEQLESVLGQAVESQMVADVPLGAFLSGGIDSSTVVALMQARSRIPVRTFSIGFTEPEFNEAVHAKAVASHLGTDHTELYVTPSEAREVIPSLATVYDEPFADSSQIPTMLVSSLARSQVTVALSGDGGDELFGGYPRYLEHRRQWATLNRVPWFLRAIAGRVLDLVPRDLADVVFARLTPLLPGRFAGKRPSGLLDHLVQVLKIRHAEELYRYHLAVYRGRRPVVIGGTEPPIPLTDVGAHPRLDDVTEMAMFLDMVHYLPDDILVKVDRASMASSLEVRVPLLDHRVVEHAWRLPLDLKIRDGATKWVLRQVLYRHVPPDLVERPKMGFGVPIDSWLRGPLRDWAEQLLSEDRLRRDGLLDPAAVRATWREHVTRERDWAYRLWGMLMLNQWLDEARS